MKGCELMFLVVLHEIETALESLVDHTAIIAAGQAELRLGRGTQERAAEFIQALAFDDESGGGPLNVLT